MTVTVAPAECPVCPGIPYESWETWRAVREGGGVFEIVESLAPSCAYCWGARQALYRTPAGWTWLPCSTCWGLGTEPRQIVVRLVERRAVPR